MSCLRHVVFTVVVVVVVILNVVFTVVVVIVVDVTAVVVVAIVTFVVIAVVTVVTGIVVVAVITGVFVMSSSCRPLGHGHVNAVFVMSCTSQCCRNISPLLVIIRVPQRAVIVFEGIMLPVSVEAFLEGVQRLC